MILLGVKMDNEIKDQVAEQQDKELSDDELLKQYNDADDDSPEFAAAKAELINRGYSFQPEGEEDDETDDAAEVLKTESVPAIRYSKIGSLVWELLYTVLALGGAAYFLITMETNGMKVGTRMIITTAVIVLFVISLGVMAGAIRKLANQKGGTNYRFPSQGYLALSFLWSIATLGALYYAIKNFVDVLKYSFKYALMSAVLPLVGVLVSIAFVAFFFTISREAQN